MAIDKGLYAAPEGFTDVEDLAGEPAIEIEIEDPESVSIGIDGIEIEIEKREPTAEDFDANLADFMSDSELEALGGDLVGEFEKDTGDRKEWIQTYVEGLKLLGLKYEDRTEPWEGACGVFHPMLTESVVRFQSEGITETFPAAGPVKTQIIGKDTKEKQEAADRVKDDMNYQLTEVMQEYRPSTRRCCGHCRWQAQRSRRCITIRARVVRQLSLFQPRTSLFLMARLAWRHLSV